MDVILFCVRESKALHKGIYGVRGYPVLFTAVFGKKLNVLSFHKVLAGKLSVKFKDAVRVIKIVDCKAYALQGRNSRRFVALGFQGYKLLLKRELVGDACL